MHNRPDNWWQADGDGQPQRNTLEMRYFFVDVLRRDYTKLHTVKELLDVYPAYLDILDRDGITTPFELACQYASAEIVLYMLGLNNDIDNLTNSEKLHWVCGRGTAGSLKVVNHILDFYPYLVTEPNKDGDLPIHVASDTVNTCPLKYQPECTEIVWRLLLAYPECLSLSCVGGSTVIKSNEMSIDDKKNK